MTNTNPFKLGTMTYPDGSEVTFEVVYQKDGWIGGRLPGEARVDEYPAEYCTVWEPDWHPLKWDCKCDNCTTARKTLGRMWK